MSEMERIIICKHCRKPEYYGEMRWLSGFCGCRDCYKAKWQDENHELYTWDDLDGKRPTMKEYREQLYPVGMRIQLDHMQDPQAVPVGTKGTITHVDDMGTLHMKWDNGSTLGVCPDVDRFHVI